MVLPTALALMLCNMDRICMAIAIVPMAAEFGWAPSVQVRRRLGHVAPQPLFDLFPGARYHTRHPG